MGQLDKQVKPVAQDQMVLLVIEKEAMHGADGEHGGPGGPGTVGEHGIDGTDGSDVKINIWVMPMN